MTLQRVGFRKTTKVMEFAAAWAVVTGQLGRPPKTIEEYSEWWGYSAATGYREQQVWREAWPEFSTPTDWFEAVGLDPTAVRDDTVVHGIFTTGQAAVNAW